MTSPSSARTVISHKNATCEFSKLLFLFFLNANISQDHQANKGAWWLAWLGRWEEG